MDRIVDAAIAVLLVGPQETELHLPADTLPAGATDGTWVRLDLGTDPPTVLGVDHELSRAREADLAGRLEQLRRERFGGRFDRP